MSAADERDERPGEPESAPPSEEGLREVRPPETEDDAPESWRAADPSEDDADEQSARSGLKFCLFGVTVLFAALLISAGIVFMEFRKFSKAEHAWPYIDESLDFDRRPNGWELQAGSRKSYPFGYAQFFFEDAADGLLVHLKLEVDPEQMTALFDANANEAVRDVLGEGVVEVQGRELRYLDVEAEGAEGLYRARIVDIGAEGAELGAVLELHRAKDSEPFTDEDVRRELAPFHVGPER